MNFENNFLDYLEQNTELVLPYFGVFKIEAHHAKFSNDTLTAPTKKIFFERNTNVSNLEFSQFISKKTGVKLYEVHQELTNMLGEWNKELLLNHSVKITNLGEIYSQNNEIFFKTDENNGVSTRFFGLENLNLNELNNNVKTVATISKYEKISMYLFLLILPLLGLCFIGFMYQNVLFGIKSDVAKPKLISSITTIPDLDTTNSKVKKDSLTVQKIKKDSSSISK